MEKRRMESQENQGLVTFECLMVTCLNPALFLFYELINLFAFLSQSFKLNFLEVKYESFIKLNTPTFRYI